jgi:hypothetical protein
MNADFDLIEATDMLPNLWNGEAEMAVVGSIMIDPDALPKARAILGKSGKAFQKPEMGRIYEAANTLLDRGIDVDFVTVCEELYRKNDHIAGIATEAINNTPTAVHVESYARTVADLAVARDTRDASSDMLKMAYSGLMPREMEAAVRDIINVTYRPYGSAWSGSVDGDKVLELLDIDQDSPVLSTESGMTTGIAALDNRLYPLEGGDLLVCLTPTSTGKTTLMLQAMKANALRGNRPIMYFNELSLKRLYYRLVVMESVDWASFQTGKTLAPMPTIEVSTLKAHRAKKTGYYEAVTESLKRWMHLCTFVPAHGWTDEQIVADFTLKWQGGKGNQVMVDYLDLVQRAHGSKNGNMSDEIGDKLSTLKNGAAACKQVYSDGIPIWVNCQTPKGFNDVTRPNMDNAFGSVRPSQYAGKFITGWRERDPNSGVQTGLTRWRIEKNPDAGNEGFDLACKVAGTMESRGFSFYAVQ